MDFMDFITGPGIFVLLGVILLAMFIFLVVMWDWKKTIVAFLQFFGLILLAMVIDRIGRNAGVDMDAVWDALKELGD